MVDTQVCNGRVLLKRTESERKPLIMRLNRIEGQIRGLRMMLEEDRYCGDELQQVKAVVAALREVGLQLVDQHLAAIVERAHVAMSDEERSDLLRIMRAASGI